MSQYNIVLAFTSIRPSPVPISAEAIATLDTRLTLEACLQQLHVLPPGRELLVGWDAVACLARLFPATWLIGILGSIFPFRTLGRLLYGFVAANRYSLSKCRGGAYRASQSPSRQEASPTRAILVMLHAGIPHPRAARCSGERNQCIQPNQRLRSNLWQEGGTPQREADHFIPTGGLAQCRSAAVWRLFTMVLYDGLAIDPGSPKMRRSLARHLRHVKSRISKIVATHAHEEHVGKSQLDFRANWRTNLRLPNDRRFP